MTRRLLNGAHAALHFNILRKGREKVITDGIPSALHKLMQVKAT